jgi:hypothetical protein
MRVRFPSPAPAEFPQLNRALHRRVEIFDRSLIEPAGLKRAKRRASEVSADQVDPVREHMVHELSERHCRQRHRLNWLTQRGYRR